MKIGVCGSVINGGYKPAILTGADYFECNFTSLASASNDDFIKAQEELKTDSFTVYAANCMFPGDMVLVGDNATDSATITEYLKRGFDRASALGIKRVVLGSGKARSVPEGYDFVKAYNQFLTLCNQIGNIARDSGCIAVIEPLCKKETNMINNLSQGAKFIEELNHPSFKLLADSYHMRAESEGFDTLFKHIDIIAHTHIAGAQMGSDKIRFMPNLPDEFNTKEFITALKGAGYKGGITIEASPPTGDWSRDAKIGVETVRTWINE